MTENHGAHGDAGATDNEDLNAQETAATNESAAASMDAQLESRAKNAAGHRRATWWIVAIVAVIAVVAVVAGCIAAFAGRKNDTTGAKANDTVTIGLKLAPTNLDIRNTAGSAIDQVLIGNVYEGLVARDEHNQVVPAIAKTWDVSDDGTTYTFHLNDGMTFSNGDKLDADDVAWFHQRARHEAVPRRRFAGQLRLRQSERPEHRRTQAQRAVREPAVGADR